MTDTAPSAGQQPSGAQPAVAKQTASQASAGQLLAQLRQAAGVDVVALASLLKVTTDKLQALEADRHEVFHDVVFMRALAASMCRALRADPAPVLALLPPGQSPLQLAPATAAGANSFRAQELHFGRSGIPLWKSRLLVLAVLSLLVAAAVVALLPAKIADLPVAQDRTQHSDGEALAAMPDPLWPQQPQTLPTDEAVSDTASTSPSQDTATPPQAQHLEAAEHKEPAADADAVVQTRPEAQPAGAVLFIRASETSWIQIRDAAGASLVQKLLQAGESVTAPGQPPWSVVVGNAASTEVLVRGEPLDIKSMAREGVARFQVK